MNTIQNLQLSTILLISIAGLLSYVLRKVPGYLIAFVKSNFIVTINVITGTDANRILADYVLQWYMNTTHANKLRAFALEPNIQDRLNRTRSLNSNPNLEKEIC